MQMDAVVSKHFYFFNKTRFLRGAGLSSGSGASIGSLGLWREQEAMEVILKKLLAIKKYQIWVICISFLYNFGDFQAMEMELEMEMDALE